MERTTETSAKLVLIRYDADGRETDRYHLHPPSPHFVDLANTLDYARSTGLQPFVDEKKGVTSKLTPAKT